MGIGNVLGPLEKDRTRNINIINFIRNYPVTSVYTEGNSVLVRGRSDEDWTYISSANLEEFLLLLGGLGPEDRCFAVLEDWMLPHVIKGREIRSRLTSLKLVYESPDPPPRARSEIVELTDSDAQYIYDNSSYKGYISVEYIRDRIKHGIGLGIRADSRLADGTLGMQADGRAGMQADGSLAAWALTHDDGAIGFLTVLEEHRRKGYGLYVTCAMTERLLERGELPFVHIEEDNVKSLNLALKAGFRIDRRVTWVKLG